MVHLLGYTIYIQFLLHALYDFQIESTPLLQKEIVLTMYNWKMSGLAPHKMYFNTSRIFPLKLPANKYAKDFVKKTSGG